MSTAPALSFGLKKHAGRFRAAEQKSAQEDAEQTQKQFITVVGDGDDDESNACEDKVIPALKNTFQVGGTSGFVPSFVPEANAIVKKEEGEDRFEVGKCDDKDAAPVRYGLDLRDDKEGAELGGTEGKEPTPEKGRKNWSEQEAEVYKRDVANLPEEANAQDYEAMPVGDFGLALLRGMNWKEGDPVGKNKANKPVEVVEFVPRDSRLGLGAKPSSITAGKKRKHMSKDDKVLAPSKDGKVRHTKTLDEKMVPRSSLGVLDGKKMHISKGSHAGLDCEVLKKLPVEDGRSERVSARLLVNDELVAVRVSDLVELSQKPSASSKKKQKMSRGNTPPETERKSSLANQEFIEKKGKKQRKDVEEVHEASWMFSGIRVRIIDKKVKKGRCYLKKGVVDDVLSPGVANVLLDGSQEVLESVSQKCLETVIPKKAGGGVLIVAGKYRGQLGKLLEKRSDKGVAAVQISEDLSIVRLHLDDLAEFVGNDEAF